MTILELGANTQALVKESPKLTPKEVFFKKYEKEVKKDLRDAEHHARNGRYNLVVTPSSVALHRRPDASCVRIDLQKACKEQMWLRELYLSLCSEKVHLSFGYECQYDAPYEDHLEDVYMLVVSFTFI